MNLYALSIELMIRGYHEYKLIWNNPVVGEDLPLCEREIGNPDDPHAVVVKKDGNLTVVGHIPRRISSICSIFLRCGGKTLLSLLLLINGLKIRTSILTSCSSHVLPRVLQF